MVDNLPEILREIHNEIQSYHSMLEGSINYRAFLDLRIMEGDQFLLYLRNLPERVVEHVQMIAGANTVLQLWESVQQYYVRSRSTNFVTERAHVTNPDRNPAAGKRCHNCGREGHFASDCPDPPKCKHCGRPGHLEKESWKKYPEKNTKSDPKAKAKSAAKAKGKGKGRGRGKGGAKSAAKAKGKGKGRGRGKGGRFHGVDEKTRENKRVRVENKSLRMRKQQKLS